MCVHTETFDVQIGCRFSPKETVPSFSDHQQERKAAAALKTCRSSFWGPFALSSDNVQKTEIEKMRGKTDATCNNI